MELCLNTEIQRSEVTMQSNTRAHFVCIYLIHCCAKICFFISNPFVDVQGLGQPSSKVALSKVCIEVGFHGQNLLQRAQLFDHGHLLLVS